MEEASSNEYIKIIKKDRVNRKTSIYQIINIKHNYTIGQIKWNGSWRQYCFYPTNETVFSSGCIDTINNLIKQLNRR